MALLDPKNPAQSVQYLIDKVNRGEEISELELIRLQTFYIGFQEVRDLVNATGKQILKGDANVLPL